MNFKKEIYAKTPLPYHPFLVMNQMIRIFKKYILSK